MRRAFSVLLLAAALNAVADASPADPRVIVATPVTHLAVGQTLRFRALAGAFGSGAPVAGELSVRWNVAPPECARIDAKGVLVALAPGRVAVTAHGDPAWRNGVRAFEIAAEVPGGRLPRLDGGPPEADVVDFSLEWPRTGSPALDRMGPTVSLALVAGDLWISTGETPRSPLPWALDAVRERSEYQVERSCCLPSPGTFERAQAALTSARLTISSWKDGVATGRLAVVTTKGLVFDAAFAAFLPDRDGVFAKAAAPVAAPR